MNRLRHPVRAIREPFGTAGLIVACVALIAALGGSAIAAKGALTGKQKKEVEKIAKKFSGKPGPAGPAGPAGSAGAKGDPGAKGDAGSVGPEGKQGPEGDQGPKGDKGPKGDPWTAGGTLPLNATETGAWTLPFVAEAGIPSPGNTIDVPVSFPIPLPAGLDDTHVHLINEAGEEVFFEPGGGGKTRPSTDCLGTPAEPKAASGHLCVYVGFLNNASPGVKAGPFEYLTPVSKVSALEGGADKSGARVRFSITGAEASGFGTFAVTG